VSLNHCLRILAPCRSLQSVSFEGCDLLTALENHPNLQSVTFAGALRSIATCLSLQRVNFSSVRWSPLRTVSPSRVATSRRHPGHLPQPLKRSSRRASHNTPSLICRRWNAILREPLLFNVPFPNILPLAPVCRRWGLPAAKSSWTPVPIEPPLPPECKLSGLHKLDRRSSALPGHVDFSYCTRVTDGALLSLKNASPQVTVIH
jgi:hypothetical protein